MKKKSFFRVECDYGNGPYRTFSTFQMFHAKHNLDNRPAPGYYGDALLTPKWDKLGGEQPNYRFGFTSKTQLLKWFPKGVLKEINNLAREEGISFFVSEYCGEEILTGSKQAIAKLRDFKIKSKIPLDKYIAAL